MIDLAAKNHVLIRFSGVVGGGMPVLDFARKCLYREEIESIRGVLNGTMNHILQRMAEENVSLRQAAEK